MRSAYSAARSTGVFRALVNARIVLATLRAALERSERSYPDDIGQIRATWQPTDGATLPANASGLELHKWASSIEESVFDLLDNLGGEGKPIPKAASQLEALRWLAHGADGYRDLSVDASASRRCDPIRHVPKAFYMDRLSPASLKLATWAREKGALVVFEPSSVGDERQFQKAVDLCHILKFSHDRLGHLRDLREAQQPRIIVETLAEEGLRVRWRGHWSDLPAFTLPVFVDGAGAGDWTTTGLIHQLGTSGAKVFDTLQKPRLLSALRFGQGLAGLTAALKALAEP